MRFRTRTTLLAICLTISVLIASGERRIPTGPDGGINEVEFSDPIVPDHEIRVGTYNIHGCKGADGVRDAARIAQQLDGLDIIGLNEVRGDIWSQTPNQAEHLAGLCGLSANDFVFAPAETQWFGAKRFGNGLMARLPLLTWQRIPLPRQYDKSCRNLLIAELRGPNGKISILVTHIARSDEREREIQLESVLDLFAAMAPPAILLADLNTSPNDPRIARFLANSDAADAITQGGVVGDRVDWILTRGLTCRAARRIDSEASDHPLFTATLATVPDTPTPQETPAKPE